MPNPRCINYFWFQSFKHCSQGGRVSGGSSVSIRPPASGLEGQPGHGGTTSLRQLLSQHGLNCQRKRLMRLAELGIMEQMTRTSSRGVKHFWWLAGEGLNYGKNLTSPGNPRETQPHFYESCFTELLGRFELDVRSGS